MALPQTGVPPVPMAQCFRAGGPIVVDGVLSDPEWSLTPALRLLSWDGQQRSDPPTTVHLCWDDTNLYIAFGCVDADVSGQALPHDSPIYQGEVAEVFLDPLGQGTSYYEFQANAAGSTLDAYYPANRDQIPGFYAAPWSAAGFRAASQVAGTLNTNRSDVDRGWTAELAIPFAALPDTGGRPPKAGQSWRLNLYRVEFAPEGSYYLAWSPTLTATPDFHVPGRFGLVRFEGSRPALPALPVVGRPPALAPPLPSPTGAPVSVPVLVIAIILAALIAVLLDLRDRTNRIT